MLHLFDANVLITASNILPSGADPGILVRIAHQAKIGIIKLPLEILEEVLDGRKADDPPSTGSKPIKAFCS